MEIPAALPPDIWARTPPAAQTYIRALEVRVAALEGRLEALQEQLTPTSQPAARRPASDPPPPPRRRRPRSKRRRGGQPGHPGSTRTLLPVDDVDEIVVLKPEQCADCHAPLSGDDPTPWRHQVIETPPITPVVTEYQWHQLVCPACGVVTRAPWPTGVPSGTYGPRVQATVALCTGAYRLSKRTTQQMMDEVFGVPMSVGTISHLEQATTAVLAAPVEEARAYVHAQEVAHLDETSWRQGDKPAWLWVAVTTWVTVCVVRLSRGGQVARELLGTTFSGILVLQRDFVTNHPGARGHAYDGTNMPHGCASGYIAPAPAPPAG
jgi:transposase